MLPTSCEANLTSLLRSSMLPGLTAQFPEAAACLVNQESYDGRKFFNAARKDLQACVDAGQTPAQLPTQRLQIMPPHVSAPSFLPSSRHLTD